MDALAALKQTNQLKEVPENQLKWLMDNGECLTIEQGDHIFKPGDDIDRLLIILEGKLLLKVAQNGQFRVVSTLPAHSITGLLPYSRADKAFGYGEAASKCHIMVLHKDKFADMIHHCHELTTALVHVMSSRIRQFTKEEQQNDKILSLGKLSAGLAHELNNPSSAVTRSTRELSKHLNHLPEKFKQLVAKGTSEAQMAAMNDLIYTRMKEGVKSLSLMERSEKEDELMDWLDEHQIEDSPEIAANLVDFGIGIEEIEGLRLKTEDFAEVISWMNQVLATEKLLEEIEDASQRINDLVTSIKSYTHMDQAPEKVPFDIHSGIDNTLTMLNHKVRKGNISIDRKYDPDLPKPEVLPGEMNQVWTNLIDNAIDAMENSNKKELTIETKNEGEFIYIHIRDTGSGIPEEVVDKIFDPFFTTKPIGKGTGLGLEVVQQIVSVQHKGKVTVKSKPGHTEFSICIPIKAR